MGTETNSEKNVQRLTLQVRGMYKGWMLQVRKGTDLTSERKVQGTNISCVRNVQGTDKCLIDGDHTDGHYNTMFAEQLTRTFEVLVITHIRLLDQNSWRTENLMKYGS